jgi:hypothetical protein
MAQQEINTGASANDRTGDSLRTAFNKINENFAELYATAYTPVDPNNWIGSAPITVAEALDRLAAALGPIA